MASSVSSVFCFFFFFDDNICDFEVHTYKQYIAALQVYVYMCILHMCCRSLRTLLRGTLPTCIFSLTRKLHSRTQQQ